MRKYIALEGILLLVIADFLFITGTSIWNAYVNIYFSSINLSGLDIGLVSTMQSAISSLTMMPAGIISDRIGRKRPIVVSCILTLIYALILITVKDYRLILMAACIQGVGLGLRNTTMVAYVLDAVQERRGVAFATYHFFRILASILGTAMGAPIAEAWGYQSVFQLGGIIVLVSGLFTFFRLQESMTASTKATGNSTRMGQSFRDGIGLMRNSSILLLVAGSVVHQVATSFSLPYLGLYLKNILFLDLILVGILLNARQIGDVVGQLPSGVLIDRIGAEAVLFIHVFLTAPIVYFFGTSSNPYILFAILFVWGSEAGWDIPSRLLLIIKYSKNVGSATALGAVQSFIGLISLSAPVIGGWMWDNLGSTLLFKISAVTNVVSCVPLAVLVWKAIRKNREPKST